MKRGPALVVLLVDISSVFYKELHHVQVLIYTGLREKEEGKGTSREGRVEKKRKRVKKC